MGTSSVSLLSSSEEPPVEKRRDEGDPVPLNLKISNLHIALNLTFQGFSSFHTAGDGKITLGITEQTRIKFFKVECLVAEISVTQYNKPNISLSVSLHSASEIHISDLQVGAPIHFVSQI